MTETWQKVCAGLLLLAALTVGGAAYSDHQQGVQDRERIERMRDALY